MYRLFSEPTIHAISAWIESAARVVGTGFIDRVPRDGDLPLSFIQERLWFLTQMDEASASYTAATAVRMRGPLRIDALQESLRAIVARHEALRTIFRVRTEFRGNASPPSICWSFP